MTIGGGVNDSRGLPDSGGAAFVLTPNAAKTAYIETVLHSFCALPNCADGETPAAGLIRDPATGILYGTTPAGGAHGVSINFTTYGGTVFALGP